MVSSLRRLYSKPKVEGLDEDMRRLKMDSRFVQMYLSQPSKTEEGRESGGHDVSFKVSFERLWDNKDRRRIFVKGATGSGKSTLLRWFAFRWAKGLLWNDQFDAVVFVSSKNAQKDAESMMHWMCACLFSKADEQKMERFVREFLSWTKEHRVLWLVDGVDEAQLKEGSLLWKIQETKPLDGGRFEYMMVETEESLSADACLVLQGLTNEGIWRFVRRHFLDWNGYDAALTLLLCMRRVYGGWLRDLQRKIAGPLLRMRVEEGSLTRFVRSLLKGWMLGICRYPTMLKHVCSVVPHLAKLERASRTVLFTLMVDQFMSRVADEKLRAQVREQLAEIAWNGFCSESLVVSKDQLSSCSEEWTNCGMLKVASTSKGEEVSWLDITLQHYLAAEHVCSARFDGNVAEELKDRLKSEYCVVFIAFFCGLGGKALECVMEGFSITLLLDGRFLCVPGQTSWIEEGGKEFEAVLSRIWEDAPLDMREALFKCALLEGSLHLVEFLIAREADVSLADRFGWTPLLYASESGNVELISFLLKLGANLNDKNRDGKTAVGIACENGHFETVKRLIEAGAHVNAASQEVCPCIVLASGKGHVDMVEYLIEQGAILNAKDENGLTALLAASQNDHMDVVACLIEHGADLEARNGMGGTALSIASRWGHLEVVKCLVKHGANIVAADEEGLTALLHAAEMGHLEIVNFLIQNGASVNSVDRDGWSALCIASQKGRRNVVHCLAEHGADLEARTGSERTALAVASGCGYLELVKCLIEHGADIEAVDLEGWTALLHASETNRFLSCKIFDRAWCKC